MVGTVLADSQYIRIALCSALLWACGRSRSIARPALDGGATAQADSGAGGSDGGLMTTGASSGAGAAGEAASARACAVQGWSVVDALPEDCRGVCQPDSLTSRLPILAWNPRADWCAGCFALDTPWATSDAQRQNAVDGYLVATGAGPDLVEIGMLTNAVDGIIGLYDGQLQPHAAFYGLDDSPCGRVASLRFSHDGTLGVHLMQTVGKEQFLYETSPQSASALFEPQNRAFMWPTSIVGQLAINDMWFSSQRQAIDLTGSLWVADLSAQSAQQVSKVPGAPAGEYSSAEVAGADVFVSRWVQGASDWWVYHPAGLTRLLGGAGLDVRQLVTDGKTIVWLEGSNPVAPEAGVGPMVFSHYALYRSAYTLDPSKIQRELVADKCSEQPVSPRDGEWLCRRRVFDRAARIPLRRSRGATRRPSANEKHGAQRLQLGLPALPDSHRTLGPCHAGSDDLVRDDRAVPVHGTRFAVSLSLV
jgi:hypothetical protein